MKRFRVEGEMESINMANVLMLLSRNVNHHDDHHLHQDSDSGSGSSSGRVFECKTCSRRFSSFQALGGHRANHKRARIAGEHGPWPGPQSAGSISKPKVHECSVCGLEFSIGQALGGHMRRHRATATATDGFAQGIAEKKSDDEERPLWLDLNLPPLDEGKERRRMVFGFELVDKTHMVDCFQ